VERGGIEEERVMIAFWFLSDSGKLDVFCKFPNWELPPQPRGKVTQLP